MSAHLDAMVRSHADRRPRGITSVCSAHPLVLEAALVQGRDDAAPVLIEATSNQVDQFGGYTGLRPADFRALVEEIAARVGFPTDRLVLGGDHLGPHRWRSEDAETAMAHAENLVRAYVAAGYTKLHLDCSYPCADDGGVLEDEVMAARAARMLAAAEAEAARVGLDGALRYVIGTEVPVPGGADHEITGLVPTTRESALATLEHHRRAFAEVAPGEVWSQVMALVVQPGVEFDHLRVFDYDSSATRSLRMALDDEPTMVFEAHSTDYQTRSALAALVADGWGVLKVGPGLTFAMREALFALAAIENELLPTAARSRLPEVVDARMLARPEEWRGYYTGTPEEQALARRYSYSDRMRYYWPDPEISAAVHTLLRNLSTTGVPEPLLSAFLPIQYDRVRRGELTGDPRGLVVDRVRDILRTYAAAVAPA
ncbi:MAG TPA: D-tagatose-bisphosphate aldolase, class II, non-catalytic subunit [Nocardioides sp.]|jgi:D-tagatose-1,6-bisphosphate aldolase subunit GatZ/KbaZ|nr:D-tagatose-bisphosphate aldolase, class II, non-catalytic subunit [Nocardioides sp.]